jgi:hypothetical protein
MGGISAQRRCMSPLASWVAAVSAVGCPRSAVGCPRSAVGCQRSAVGCQRSTDVNHTDVTAVSAAQMSWVSARRSRDVAVSAKRRAAQQRCCGVSAAALLRQRRSAIGCQRINAAYQPWPAQRRRGVSAQQRSFVSGPAAPLGVSGPAAPLGVSAASLVSAQQRRCVSAQQRRGVSAAQQLRRGVRAARQRSVPTLASAAATLWCQRSAAQRSTVAVSAQHRCQSH